MEDETFDSVSEAMIKNHLELTAVIQVKQNLYNKLFNQNKKK